MRLILSLVALCGLIGVSGGEFDSTPGPSQDPAAKPSPPSSPTAERFDKLVREDLFAGFGGDEAALARGLAQCEATLKDNPQHAEAMVWRGAVRVFQASRFFGKKEMVAGFKLWSAGIEDMDEAVKLAPDYPGVRIPRAAVLLPAARGTPPAMSGPLLKRVRDDYETIARLQANETKNLGTHPLGELRMGLADVYRLSGDQAKSREQLKLVLQELPQTDYATRATDWLAAPADAKLAHSCIGCHGQ